MLNRKQAKLLRKFANITACTKRVRALSADKITLDDINKNNPGAIDFYYAGKAVSFGYDKGFHLFELTKVARNLLAEWEETAIVGYAGRARDKNGEFSFHLCAENESRLRAQLKRHRHYNDVEILELDPCTKAQYTNAYGWGAM